MFGEHVQPSRAERKAATRRRVLAGADRLFRERGYVATTVRDIALHVGVSVGSVMTVGDKAALLVTIYEDRIADIHRDRADAVEITDVDGVVDLFLPFVEYFEHDPDLTRHYGAVVMTEGAQGSVVFGELAAALIREIHDALLTLGLDPSQAQRGSRVIYFTYLGLVLASSQDESSTEASIEQLRDTVHLVVSQGLR